VEANRVLGFSEDERDYAPAAQILKALGIERVLLFTNNRKKAIGLEKYGIEVIETKRLYGRVTPYNRFYLSTKMRKLGHKLEEILGEVNS
jgi:3,4-dihydroxy 2-butanone 4-phosphate synthase/GTP cyclohydrolase II